MPEGQERELLEAVVRADAEGNVFARDKTLAEALGWEVDRTIRVLTSLIQAGYLLAVDGASMGGQSWMRIRPTERARREVGQWPSEDPWTRLIAALERSIEEEPDPSRRAKLIAVRDSVLGAGRDVVLGALGPVLAAGVTGF